MISDRAKQLLDKQGFIDAYYEGVRVGLSCQEAFDAVNIEHFELIGKYRYVDYDSFRKVRDYKPKVTKLRN